MIFVRILPVQLWEHKLLESGALANSSQHDRKTEEAVSENSLLQELDPFPQTHHDCIRCNPAILLPGCHLECFEPISWMCTYCEYSPHVEPLVPPYRKHLQQNRMRHLCFVED